MARALPDKGRRTKQRWWIGFLAAALTLALANRAAAAGDTVKEVKIAVQFGLAFLPVLVAEERGFIEARLKEAGLPNVEVELVRFSGAPAVNDAVLSGQVSFAAYGTTGFLIAWDKTRGSIRLKGVCGISVVPNVFLTNKPEIKNVTDFGPEDRISTPATTSPQAMTVRLALEKAYGAGAHGRLDSQMVTQSNPDGMRALVNGLVQGLVTTPPFVNEALIDPKIRAIGTLEDGLGGPSTFIILATRESFAKDNPKITAAMLAAMNDANALITSDPNEAARIYIKSESSKMQPTEVKAIIQGTGNLFTTEPLRVGAIAGFMGRTGQLRQAPADWKELFMPPITDGPGS